MDTLEKTEPLNYAGRGLAYDYEGTNRNLNVGYATLAERQAANPATPSDPNQLPGTAEVSEHDALDGTEGAGYLWNAALGAGLSVRNYGFFLDLARYCTKGPPGFCLPLLHDPASMATVVA